MRLTKQEQENLITTIAPQVVVGWSELSDQEQATFTTDLREKVLPILASLPPEQDPQELFTMGEFFKQAALDLILMRLNRVQIFKGQASTEALARIASDDLEKYALHLMVLTQCALVNLPVQKTLVDLLAEFEAWDVDAEVANLMRDEGDN